MKEFNIIKKIKLSDLFLFASSLIISFVFLYLINLVYKNFIPSDMYIHQRAKRIIFCALASTSFCIYCRYSKHFRNISFIYYTAFSLGYGLSSYSVLSNHYLQTMLFFIAIPFLFLSYENLSDNKGYILFTVITAICLCISSADTCIFLIYLSLYFIILSNDNFAKRMVNFLHLLLCYVFSFLLSFAICIPQLASFFSDNIDSTYPGFSINYAPAVFLSRLLPGSAPSDYFSYGRGLDLYFGMFFFILLILYFFNNNIAKKERFKNFCFLLLVIGTMELTPLMFAIELFQSIQWASIYYSVFFTFYCLSLAGRSLANLSNISKKNVIYGLFFSTILMLYILIGSSHNFMPLTIKFILCLFALYVLGIIMPFFSSKSSTNKLLPLIILFELFFSTSIMINKGMIPASLDIVDSFSIFSADTKQFEYDSNIENDIKSEQQEKYEQFFEEKYATDISDTLYFIGDHIKLTTDDIEKYGKIGDLNKLEEFNIRGHLLGVKEDVFVEEDIDFIFDSAEDYKVICEGNNLYCVEQKPQTLSNQNIILSYHYSNPDKKHYIILCSLYDYLVEDMGESDSFDGLLCISSSKNLSFRFKLSAYSINDEAMANISAALFTDADPATYKNNTNNNDLIYLIISAIGFILLLHFTIDRGKKKTIEKLNTFKERLLNARIWGIIAHFMKSNHIYIFAFTIPFLTFIFAMIFFNCAPFGERSFLDSDGISSVMAAILNNYYNFKEDNFNLSMLGGYAMGIFPGLYIIYYLPILLFSAEALPSVFMVTNAILMGFSGFSVCYYLTHRLNSTRANKKDYKLLIPALMYSLNTYMLAMHSYIFWWFLLFALFPLLVLFQERLIYQKKWFPYSMLLFFCIMTNFNIAFYICIFLVIHFFTCRFDSIKDFIIKSLRFAIASLLGAFCHFSNLYGLFAGLFSHREGTGYAVADSVTPTFRFFTSYFNQWRQFMIFTPCKTVTYDNGHINLYVGVLFLIIFAIFLSSKKINIRQKLCYLIPTIILFISFNEEISAYIWNGLHYQVGVPNRHTFLFLFIASLISYEVMSIIQDIDAKKIAICTICSILFVCMCQFLGDGNTKFAYTATLVFLSIYFIVLVIFNHIKTTKKYLIPMLICIFILEITSNVFYSCNSFSSDDICIFEDYEKQADFHTKLLQNDNTNEYRFSLPATYGSNNGMITNAPSGTLFNSFLSNILQNMNEYYGLYYGHNFIMNHHNGTPLTTALSSCKYIEVSQYSAASLGDLYNYDYYATINNYFVLSNPNVLSLGIYVPDSFSNLSDDAPENAVSFQNYLVREVTKESEDIMVGPQMLSFIESNTDIEKKKEQNTITFKSPDGKIVSAKDARDIIYGTENSNDPIFTSHNLYCDISITPLIDGPIYLYANEYVYLGEGKKGEKQSFSIPYPNKTYIEDYEFSCYSFNTELFQTFIKTARMNELENVKIDDNLLTADIDYEEDGYTMFSLPYSTAWKIYIDDEETKPDNLMNSYLFVKTPAGKHQLKMVYDNSEAIRDVFISIGIIFSLCLLAYIEKKYKKAKEKKTTFETKLL